MGERTTIAEIHIEIIQWRTERSRMPKWVPTKLIHDNAHRCDREIKSNPSRQELGQFPLVCRLNASHARAQYVKQGAAGCEFSESTLMIGRGH